MDCSTQPVAGRPIGELHLAVTPGEPGEVTIIGLAAAIPGAAWVAASGVETFTAAVAVGDVVISWSAVQATVALGSVWSLTADGSTVISGRVIRVYPSSDGLPAMSVTVSTTSATATVAVIGSGPAGPAGADGAAGAAGAPGPAGPPGDPTTVPDGAIAQPKVAGLPDDLAARPTAAALADDTGASLVGTSTALGAAPLDTVLDGLVDGLTNVSDGIATKEDIGVAADLVAEATLPGSVGTRPTDLGAWFSAYASRAAGALDVVMLGDSIAEQDATGGGGRAWPYRLARRLNGKAPQAFSTDGWISAAPGVAYVPGFTNNPGTVTPNAPGGRGTTLTNGQKSNHTATMDGFSLVYRTDPSYGSLIVRDGIGGTVLATIPTNTALKYGNVWTSGALALASHTIEVESVGANTIAGGYVHQGDRVGVRMWNLSRGGQTTQFHNQPHTSLDFVEQITPDLVIIATGTNDGPSATYSGYVTALVASIRTRSPGTPIALWVPHVNTVGFAAGNPVVARALAATLGLGLIDAATLTGEVSLDATRWAGIGPHPNDAGLAMYGDQAAAVLTGDPFGERVRAGAGEVFEVTGSNPGITIETATSKASFTPGGVSFTDTSFLRTGPSVFVLGSPLSLFFAKPDGEMSLRRLIGKSTPRVSTIATPAAPGLPVMNTDDFDVFSFTALAAAVTSFTTNLTGTPHDFERMVIRLKDNGTARALVWGAKFEARGTALPTSTVISKQLRVEFEYDSISAKWGCISSLQTA